MARKSLDHRYFIRDGYESNAARSADPSLPYWSDRRVEASALFQYSTYKEAASLMRRIASPRVLDLGCGTARKAARLLIPNCGFYLGIDQPAAVEYCRANITASNAEFQVGDLEAPGLSVAQPFDVIICADVIEHLISPGRLLAFAVAALAPGGYLVVSTPERDVLHGRNVLRPPNPDHVREWNRAELRQLLTSFGLVIRTLRLAPQFRLSASKIGVTLLRGQLRRPLGYWGCQVATCTKG